MAAESRRSTAAVEDLLFEEPGRFEFFEAVRLLREHFPDREPIGEWSDPDREFVRFRSAVSLAFPVSDLTAIERPAEPGKPVEMSVGFMGVCTPGSFGSLPSRYAVEVHEQEFQKNTALRAFFDVFNHRFVSLFFRAWEKYRFALRFERGEPDNTVEEAVFGVLGLATPGLHGRLPFDDRALIGRAGLLAMAPVPPGVLEQLVESYFGVPARTLGFKARWYRLDPADRSRIGTANSRLGDDLVVGEAVHLNQFRFRLRLGPMDWETYVGLLPASPGYPALLELVRLAVPEEFDFECQLVLRREDVPPLRLGGDAASGARLGWTTWIAPDGLDRDADDAIFSSDQKPFAISNGEDRAAPPAAQEAAA